MRTIKRQLIISSLVLFSVTAFSQENDFGVWVSASAQHKLVEKLDIELSGSLRTFNNVSQIEQFYIEGGVQYKFNKFFSLAGSYRLIKNVEDNSQFYFRHKLFADVKGTIPLNNFTLSARLRLQRTSKTYIENDEDLISKYLMRLKIKTLYNIPSFPINPYTYCELFSPVISDSGSMISKYRLSAGAEINLKGKTSIEAEYIFQRDFLPHLSNRHIVSIGYNVRF